MSFPCCFHWINRRLSCFRARGCNLILLESLNLDFTPWGMWCHFSFAELFLVILLGHILYYLENSKNMMLYHLNLVWLVHPIVFVDPYWVIFTVNSVKALHWQDLVSVCKKIISFICWCGISQMHISCILIWKLEHIVHPLNFCYWFLFYWISWSPLTTLFFLSEFSESLREMGDCLLEKTALNDDEESGKHQLSHACTCYSLKKLKMISGCCGCMII